MNIKIGTSSFSFPVTTNWFTMQCNNLQMVTLLSTGWSPIKSKVNQVTNAAAVNLEGNANTIVVQLSKLNGYLNAIKLSSAAYIKWAEDMENARNRDREAMGGEGCPRLASAYATQKNAAITINEEAINLMGQVNAAIASAENLAGMEGSGGPAYNQQLEQTIADLQNAGSSAEKAQKRSQIAIAVVALAAFAFIIYRIMKR